MKEGARRGLRTARAPPPFSNEDTKRERSQAPADLLCSTPGFPATRNIKFARGAAGGTGPFSSGGCWNCNYRETVSGGKLTWTSTHVPCVFHLQTCGLYSTFSFNREWVKEAERGCKHSVTIDLDLLFLQEQKGTAKGQLRVKILYYIQIHSSAEEEIRSVIEWSMRNRLTTEVAVNTMLGDTPPTPALPPLKGNEGPRSRRF